MKVVFMIAGQSSRLGAITQNTHKCLTEIGGKPIIQHLIERFCAQGYTEFVCIVGHAKKEVMAFIKKIVADDVSVTFIDNPKFDTANNMYTMWCARDELLDIPFVLCNGDVVLNEKIISFLPDETKSSVVIDDFNKDKDIDSPKVTVEDRRIYDLGRHVDKKDSSGYAIGLYTFNKELSSAYFEEIDRILQAGRLDTGFHDPLMALFVQYPVSPISTRGLAWTDIDTPEDIPRAEQVMKQIVEQEDTKA